MKLYTEEQLIKYLLDEGIMELFDLENNLVPHIELPSDEEIQDNKFPLNSPEQELYNDGWEEGAKWMRDKIQGGNKL
jgi:hypothetical protein